MSLVLEAIHLSERKNGILKNLKEAKKTIAQTNKCLESLNSINNLISMVENTPTGYTKIPKTNNDKINNHIGDTVVVGTYWENTYHEYVGTIDNAENGIVNIIVNDEKVIIKKRIIEDIYLLDNVK